MRVACYRVRRLLWTAVSRPPAARPHRGRTRYQHGRAVAAEGA